MCRDSRRPRAAVGSSRITTRVANATARMTATAWRWPPDMTPIDWRGIADAHTEPIQVLPPLVGHLALLEEAEPSQPRRAAPARAR